jgi:hypothetical protein
MTHGTLKAPPPWLKRLSAVRREYRDTAWPADPEEGLQQSLTLADFGFRLFLEGVRKDHPAASEEEVPMLAYRILTGWQRVRNRLALRSR